MSRRKIILTGIAIVLGLLVFIPVLYHYHLKAEVTRFRAEMKAKGIPSELSEVLPPPISPAQDGLQNFLKAVSLFDTNKSLLVTNSPPAMRMVAPGKAMIGFSQPEIRDGKVVNSWEEMRAAADQEKEGLELLERVNGHPEMDFHIEYEKGFCNGSLLPVMHLVDFKKTAILLKSAALLDLRSGNGASPVKRIQTILTLVNAMQHQRLEISELVRIAMTTYAQSASWELLQSDRATDFDLASLQKSWEQVEFIKAQRDALLMELLCGNGEVDKWRTSRAEFQKLIDMWKNARVVLGTDDGDSTFFKRTKMSLDILMWQNWWSYTDELRSLKGHEVLLGTANFAITNGAFALAFQRQNAQLDTLGINELTDSIERALSGEMDFHNMFSEAIKTLGNSFKKTAQAETMKRMTIAAIAIKRFQLKHGSLPTQLSQLAPDFLTSVPIDPADNKPLRYRLNEDGTFLLYSIGLDGADDNGNPEPADKKSTSLNWQNGRDWVWPQPATEQEIKVWQARQQKLE